MLKKFLLIFLEFFQRIYKMKVLKKIKKIFVLFFLKIKSKKILNDYIKRNKPIKLHLGCGKNIKENWINVDFGRYFFNKRTM